MVEAHVRSGRREARFSGTPGEVVGGIMDFLAEEYPDLPTVSKLITTPEGLLPDLAKGLAGLGAITPEGLVLTVLDELRIDVKDSILLSLALAYAGKRFGKLESDALSFGELMRLTRSDAGGVAGGLSRLVRDGLALRAPGRRYRISTLGMRRFLDLKWETRGRGGSVPSGEHSASYPRRTPPAGPITFGDLSPKIILN